MLKKIFFYSAFLKQKHRLSSYKTGRGEGVGSESIV
jgi:hypothetical protein